MRYFISKDFGFKSSIRIFQETDIVSREVPQLPNDKSSATALGRRGGCPSSRRDGQEPFAAAQG
jgi:hypothetical protein